MLSFSTGWVDLACQSLQWISSFVVANQQSLKQKQGGYGHVCSLYPNILSSITLICSYVQTTSAVCQCALLVTRSCDVGHICLSAICSSAPPTSGVRFEKKVQPTKMCKSKGRETKIDTRILSADVCGWACFILFPFMLSAWFCNLFAPGGQQFALVAKRARISCRCLFACELYSA